MKKITNLFAIAAIAAFGISACEEKKTDVPAPKKEEPKKDAPKKEEPKKADAPKADAPKADAPKADAPKADAPAPSAPTHRSLQSRRRPPTR